MRYVVGYSANDRGRDAVSLAVALARGRGASLDLVLVVPEVQQFAAAHAPKAGFENLLHEQAREWLNEALALVPDDVPAQAHIRTGDSDAHALIEAAEEFGADILVIGATNAGLFKRFTIGSVASSLLHASTVPVALAPHGYHRTEALTRISCGLGTRAGAGKLLDFAIGMAANRGIPLRVVSLLALDGGDTSGAADSAREYAEKTVAAAAPVSPSGAPLVAETDVVVAQGRAVEEAVDDLRWEDGEVLVIGSSRLAHGRSIFLGSTANRILRALPVPMLVVPSGYELKDQNPETSNVTSREARQ
ncbi:MULTISPECIES: universal stress protein [unclassified Arthrobacter]|uniref:universal stress protein n=1 Tax=unclassified Arthrobacter TaxID=235627 RepID=UPI002DFDF8DF|nr:MULTISPECIES: universal stress protein [unclassified Arthrobacter]MEC5192792.1 nucleotide-binding universal stress UspA family protein [Arthrobacter sp. MP_M4]MEC5204323.1 nucleotide-binding universal stress UspA family protein [Arthrobacter sp. MP_M7]